MDTRYETVMVAAVVAAMVIALDSLGMRLDIVDTFFASIGW